MEKVKVKPLIDTFVNFIELDVLFSDSNLQSSSRRETLREGDTPESEQWKSNNVRRISWNEWIILTNGHSIMSPVTILIL